MLQLPDAQIDSQVAEQLRVAECSGPGKCGITSLAGQSRWILAFAVLLAIVGCRSSAGPGPDITVRERITPQPLKMGPATVEVQLTDAARKPVAGANIQVEGDMSHPGMSPVFADAAETSPGSYQARLDFSMAGDWVILLHIRLPGGRKFVQEFQVPGVSLN